MKKLKNISVGLIVILFGLTACEGPQGPAGLDGFDGIDGVDATIFELGGFNFTNENGFFIREDIPADIILDDTDPLLVFRLRDIDANAGDIWEPLPAIYFTDEGTLQYTFDHSSVDFSLYMLADFDLSTFEDPEFTDNQTFRFAVIPAELSNASFDIQVSELLKQMNTSKIIKLN